MKKVIVFMVFSLSLLILQKEVILGQPWIIHPPNPNIIPCDDWNNSDPNEPNCKNIGCDNPNAPWQLAYEVVSLPNFPDCYFAYWFCYRVCNENPHTVQLNGFWFSQAVQPCLDCDNWLTWLQSDLENNGKLFTLMLWEQVTLKLYQKHIDYLDSQNELHLAYCPNSKIEYTSTVSSCRSLCYYQYFEDGVWLNAIEQVECNQGSCCVYNRKYCVDPMTHEIVIEGTTFLEEVLQDVGPCPEQFQVQFGPDCNNGFNKTIKPCNNNCVEPE